ncbi:MAG TPA: acyltransferase [Isosphaeraceae bacterium]|nr:acyltransferase [Isosphaeraceae bacterium]
MRRTERTPPRIETRSRPAGPRPVRLSVDDKIDACRGLFAYLVVVAHALEVAWGVHPEAAGALPGPVRLWLQCTVGSGIYWVMGFFVISGYCIHLSADRLRAGDRFPLKVYLVARLSRILPLYYASLALTVLVEWLIAPARPRSWPNGLNGSALIAQLFVAQNLTQTYGSFASSWSITNEVFYYGLYGLLCVPAIGRGDRPARVGMALCLAIATAMQVLYYTVAHRPFILSAGMLFGLGINWFLGVLVAAQGPALVRSGLARHLARLWGPLLVLAVLWRFDARLPSAGTFLLSGAAFTLLMIRFLQAGPPDRSAAPAPWIKKGIEWLGMSSYPTYLFHGPLIMLIGSAILRRGLVSDWRLTWAILSVAGIASGLVLAFVAERPVMTWRGELLRRLKSGRSASPRRIPAPMLGAQRYWKLEK